MTSIVSWNVQNGKGCDGAIDLARIARVTRALGEADVICFQEIARNDPAFGGTDQVRELAGLFEGYQAIFGPTLMRQGGRDYGNLILARLPVLQAFNHLLPHPAEGGIKHMQRQAIEVVVQTSAGPLRVTTTHLEYYSARHRAAQIDRLRQIQEEVAANEASPALAPGSPYDAIPRPAAAVLCGDLNLAPGDAQYAQLYRAPFVDAWKVVNGEKRHPDTTGLHDRVQWPMGGHCRDYFALTADVARRVVSLGMDAETDASDHQPLRLVLE